MDLAKTALLFMLASAAVGAQVNKGEQKSDTNLPFTMTPVTTFELPWRIAFLPDGRMLVTEKIGPVWLLSPQGQKIAPVGNTPPVYWQGQNGMLGVYVSPNYAADQRIYLTYAEPGDYGGGLALARAKLNATASSARLENFEVLWRQLPRGKGGQEGAAVAFSPDGQSLFLTVGDRQRFTPAQDPDQPVGKILRLTLDGKPAPGNPHFGKSGAAMIPLIDPPSDTETAKTAKVVSTYTFTGPNMTPAETWATGVRTPYGLAFSPDRRIVGGRAWPARRRRAEPDREGQELWLATRVLQPELQRRADSESGHAAGSDQAGHLLDAGHRARQHHVLQGRDVPAVGGLGADWRHGEPDAEPCHVRRQRRRHGRRALGCRPPHPRRGSRSRRRAVDARGRQSRRPVSRDAEIASPLAALRVRSASIPR